VDRSSFHHLNEGFIEVKDLAPSAFFLIVGQKVEGG
jgi:hypothetical protein